MLLSELNYFGEAFKCKASRATSICTLVVVLLEWLLLIIAIKNAAIQNKASTTLLGHDREGIWELLRDHELPIAVADIVNREEIPDFDLIFVFRLTLLHLVVFFLLLFLTLFLLVVLVLIFILQMALLLLEALLPAFEMLLVLKIKVPGRFFDPILLVSGGVGEGRTFLFRLGGGVGSLAGALRLATTFLGVALGLAALVGVALVVF